jgi:hypothetical protein
VHSLIIVKGQGLDPDAILGSWTLPGQPKVKVEGYATPAIAFVQPEPEAAQGRQVWTTFNRIGEYMAELITEAEERFPGLKRPVSP